MATRKPSPKDAPADFDDLLGTPADAPAGPPAPVSGNDEITITSAPVPAPVTDAEPASPVTTAEPEAPVETEAQKRIRALKAELSKPIPKAQEPIFEPEVPKTAEELEIEELEMQVAQRNAAILEATPETFVTPEGDAVLIHVVQDGFTEFGRVWLRGQELRIGKREYARTKDRNGVSWVDTLLNDPHRQFAQWGAVFVAPGPFVPRPGEVFNDALAQEDARRKGAIPVSQA